MTREEALAQNANAVALFNALTSGNDDVETLVDAAYANLLGLEGEFSNAAERKAFWIRQFENGNVTVEVFAEEFLYQAENVPGSLTAEEQGYNARTVPVVVNTAKDVVTQLEAEGRSLEDLAPQEVEEAIQVIRTAIFRESDEALNNDSSTSSGSNTSQAVPDATGDISSGASDSSSVKMLSVDDVLAMTQLPNNFEIVVEQYPLYLRADDFRALERAIGRANNEEEWQGFAYRLYGDTKDLISLEDSVIQNARSVTSDGFAAFEEVQHLIDLNSAWEGFPIVMGTTEQHKKTELIADRDYLPGLEVSSDALLGGDVNTALWNSVYLDLQDSPLPGERLIELAQWHQSQKFKYSNLILSGSADLTLEERVQLDRVAPYFLDSMQIEVALQTSDTLPVLSMYEATDLVNKILYPDAFQVPAEDVSHVLPPFILEDHYHALTDTTRYLAAETRQMAELVRVIEPVTPEEATELKRWQNFDAQSVRPLLSVTRDDADVDYEGNTYDAVGFSSVVTTLNTFFGETLIFRGDGSRVAFSNTTDYAGDMNVVLRGSDNVLNLQGLDSGLNHLEVLLGSNTRMNVIDAGQLSGDILLVTSQREWGTESSSGDSQIEGLKADSATGTVEISTQGKSFGLTGTLRAEAADALVLQAHQGNIVDAVRGASWQFNGVESAQLVASGGDIYLNGPMTLANGSHLEANVSAYNTVSLSRLTLAEDEAPDTFTLDTQGEGDVFISNESFRLNDNSPIAFDTFTLVADARSTSLWLDEVASLVASGSGDSLRIESLFLTQQNSKLDFSDFSGNLSLNLQWFDTLEEPSTIPGHDILLGQGENRIGNREDGSRDSDISVNYVFDDDALQLELADSFHGFPQGTLFDLENDVLDFSGIEAFSLSGMTFNGRTFDEHSAESLDTFLSTEQWDSHDTYIGHESFALDILLAGVEVSALSSDSFLY